MSLRIDPALNSPRKMEVAPSNMKKPEARLESRPHAAPTKLARKSQENSSEDKRDTRVEKKSPTHVENTNSQKKSKEVNEQDDDLLFSAELENQMASDELSSLEGMEEVAVTPKQAVTALSALAGIAAAQENVEGEAPVEVIFNNAPQKTIIKPQNSDLQALLNGPGDLNGEMPVADASLYNVDATLLNAGDAEGELTGTGAKPSLVKNVDTSSKIVDNENVVDLLNQKKNLRNPVQAQYANQNPKFVLEKIMKEVKAKAGVSEMTPDEAKMINNIDMLTDADKMVKLVGGEKEFDTKSQMSLKASDKVFDMSRIKSSNANEIIDQISNHIIQNQTARSTNVDLAVNHADLGRININVSKLNPDQVNIQIMTHTPEGKQFFAENSRGLLNHLASNGVNVNDLKLDNTSSSNLNSGKDNSNSSEQFAGGQRGQQSPNQSEDNNRRQDSKRREDLWDLYRRNAA